MRKIISLLMIVAGVSACAICTGNLHKKNKTMITVTSEGIKSPFQVSSDKSVNLKRFSEHYALHPESWNAAFQFLSENNLKELPVGKTIINADVYATVSEYTTKNSDDALFESHKEYIDLQYIINGKESIGLTHDTDLPVSSLYNKEKDIAFYTNTGGTLLTATPNTYFIFFPEDIHRPCIKIGQNSKVKKIVLKIKL
ncbi:MAG: YhcH/YjgK/YiaL family protein [Paludibacteraceae bacterium]